jgi:dephospho-CoA kinase
MILGLTGGIAAGKSRVAAALGTLGAEVVSADELAREVVLPGSHVLRQLTEYFGSRILLPDGSLNRPALGALVFADPVLRQSLNRIIHPAIATLAEARLREAAGRSRIVVYEAPLLFEVGAEKRVDAVLVVTASEEVRLQRLMARDALDEQEARARLASQMPQEEKAARSDYLIDNSGDWGATEAQVMEIWQELCTRAR